MTTILLTGKSGQVGQELTRTLPRIGKVIAVGRPEFDLTNPDSIRRTLASVKPDIVVNTAGYTMVDKAETEPELAMRINEHGTRVLADEMRRTGSFLLHYSSAYVFDGAIGRPYTETDIARPVNAYGKSKLAGERAIAESGVSHLILRLSWVYCDHGRNFLLTMLGLAKEKTTIDVVDDHVASPTWARRIAAVTGRILAAPRQQGLYHYSAAGETSRYGWTVRLFELLRENGYRLEKNPVIRPVPASEYPDTAVRPAHCAMSNQKLERDFGVEVETWEEQLRACIVLMAKGPVARVMQLR